MHVRYLISLNSVSVHTTNVAASYLKHRLLTLLMGQLHFHESTTDIRHGSIYVN